MGVGDMWHRGLVYFGLAEERDLLVDAVLRKGTKQLEASGYSSQSAFLTSSTFGGLSWLAHSTLQSGTWVDSQLRYNQLVESNRQTLTSAFKRAGWRSVFPRTWQGDRTPG